MKILLAIWKWWCESLKFEAETCGSTDSHRWENKSLAIKRLSAGKSKT